MGVMPGGQWGGSGVDFLPPGVRARPRKTTRLVRSDQLRQTLIPLALLPTVVSLPTMSSSQRFLPVFQGKVAITSFILSVMSILVLSNLPLWVVVMIETVYFLSLLLLMYSLPIVQVLLCSHFLGTMFSVGVLSAVSGERYCWFGFYAMALAFFHFSEYVLTSIFNSNNLSIDSFLLNHSAEYVTAAILSWIEFWMEYYFFPELKALTYVSLVGAMFVIAGECVRKLAMITAGSNFTHLVQYRKRSGHELVTYGVYALFRHPSYVGWFYWSIGTQILLCNPVCLVGYALATWIFFKERIEDEEESLIMFFGEDYIEYKRQVGTGLPFNPGYPMDKAQELLKYKIN